MPRWKTYTYELLWYDDDPIWFDLQATTFKKAVRAVYDEWRQTGYEAAVVIAPGHRHVIDVDLDAPTFERAAHFDKAGTPA